MPNLLAEPNPNSMDEQMRRLDDIMSSDPRSLTRADRDQVIAHYRSLRAQWARDEATGKTRARAPKTPPGQVSVRPEDLGL